MQKLKIAKILIIVAVIIHSGSLFLPYNVKTTHFLGQAQRTSESGFDLVAPLLAMIPAILIMILHLIKHSMSTKVIVLILSILMVFPVAPIVWFVTIFSFYGNPQFHLGFYLFGISVIILFTASILKISTRVKRPTGLESDLLDSF